MKLQITPKLQQNSKQQQTPNEETTAKPAFKGGELTGVLNFIQTNQAVGATLVDAGCMCTPRTIVDFSRSPEAGIETARREFSSNINDAALGVYGMGAAWAVSKLFSKNYDKTASINTLYTDNDALDILDNIRVNNTKTGSLRDRKNLEGYLHEVLDTVKAYNPNAEIAKQDENGYIKLLKKEDKDVIVKKLADELEDEVIQGNRKGIRKYWAARDYVKSILVGSTGTEDGYKLEKEMLDSKGEIVTKKSSVAAKEFVDNIYKTTRAFMTENVINAEKGKFVKDIKALHGGTAFVGIAICAGLGAAVQPINMYLTRKKTGTTGFVGGGEEDKSAGFKTLKYIVGAAAAAAAVATIGRNKFFQKIQFKGFLPTLDQFKLVYGITIVSRLLSARNKNELRESSIKDSLGFANWLILGGFASKLAALGIEKLNKGVKFTKYNAAENKANLFGKEFHMPQWISSVLVSREEVLHDALKQANISAIKDGKALSVRGMVQELEKITDVALKKSTKSKLRNIALIQFAGYAWSALALGIAIPKLNIAITKSAENKRKTAQQATKEQTIEKQAA